MGYSPFADECGEVLVECALESSEEFVVGDLASAALEVWALPSVG